MRGRLLPSSPSSPSTRARSRGLLSRSVVGALAAALVAPLLGTAVAAPAGAASPRTPALGSTAPQAADLAPMVQTDGIVYGVEIVGDQVWAVGDFDRARPAGVPRGGAGEVERHGLLVADVRTGQLLPTRHDLTGTPFTSTENPGKYCSSVGTDRWLCDAAFRIEASPDGSRVYVGGDFTAVGGQSRSRLAAFDTASGALVAGFRPAFSSRVRALAVTADRVYVGGGFTSVDAQPRERLAALGTDGRLLPWAPAADATVWSTAASSSADRVVVGGQFDTLAGQPREGLGAVLADGTSAPWAADLGANRGSWVTDMSVVGGTVYAGANGEGGLPQFDGRLAADVATGNRLWTDGCRGATQAVAVDAGLLYSASHAHNCESMDSFPERSPRYYQRILAETLTTTRTNRHGEQVPELLHWYPNTDGGPSTSPFKNGPWGIDAEAGRVVVGGEFLTVNGQPQEGLARFLPRSATSQRSGPQTPFPAPQAVSLQPGEVRVTFTPTWDRDDPRLTYTLLRDEQPVARVDVASGFWAASQETQVYLDRAVAPGATHTYRLRVSDPDGNSIGSPSAAPVTVASGSPLPAAPLAAVRDGATHLWRLGGPAATAGRDLLGAADLTASGAVTYEQPGALGSTQDDGAVSLPAATSAYLRTTTATPATQALSVEAWFSTSSANGALMGQASGTTNNGAVSDRVLSVVGGRLVFGVDNRNFGSAADFPRVTSPGRVDDGAWHHVVATAGDHGLELYLDGRLVVADRLAAHSDYATRFWKLGAYDVGRFGPANSSAAARLDEVAFYSRVLSPEQVSAHYDAGTGRVPPVARATGSCTDLECTFDASGSTDDGGAAALSYAWDFGDGSTGTGVSPTHTYAQEGPRTARVTVTDGDGLASTASVDVTPRAPSVFSARDTFSRSVGSGWGSAERGGPWSLRYNASSFSVTDGQGVVDLPGSGKLRTAWLTDVAETSSSTTVRTSLSRLPSGSDQTYVWVVPRQVALDSDYRARVRVASDGSVRLAAARRTGTGVDTTLGAEVAVPGLVAAPGAQLSVRTEAEGTDPTTVRAKVWATGTPEPAAWQVERTDSTPSLQAPGGVALAAYMTGSSSAALQVRFDELTSARVGSRPAASATGSCTERTCSFDATGSTSGDGGPLSYTWDLGDGTTATGPTPTRTYAADGTYRAVVTVTDGSGQRATAEVTVTTQTATLARDTFSRASASGWGTAELGGAWTLRYSASSFSVTDGAGVITLPGAGRYRSADLGDVAARDVDLSTTFAVDRLPAAGAQQFLWATVRRAGVDTDYRARLRVFGDGSVRLGLVRRDGTGSDVTLAEQLVPGLTAAPGQPLAVRVRATGASPTTLQARVWRGGSAEPSAWQVTTTDATAAQQAAGGVGVAVYVTGSGSGDPTTVRVDDLVAAPPAA